MKLLTFRHNGEEKVGVMTGCGKGVYPVEQFGLEYDSMNELLELATAAELELLRSSEKDGKTAIPISEVSMLAPIPMPRQDVICLGINYMAHAEESARYKAEAFGGERPFAVYFSKRVNEAIGDGGNIDGHFDIVDSLDYEAELAVIIGRDCKNVSEADAEKYIFGYTIINDVSARNLQTAHKQWYFGKSLDTFFTMGPWIVSKDEIAFPPILNIKTTVNGELRQDSTTGLLIFGIPHIISELSKGMTLKAGTIIATGTPSGVGMGMIPPRFLTSGDVVRCEIQGIGSLTNIVK